MSVIGTSNQLATLGNALGYSQGGAPSNVLGYKASPAPAAAAPDYNALYQRALDALNSIKAPPAPTALNYDWSGQNAKARALAESSVNPLYQQKLNDFLAGEEVKKTRANEDATTQNTDLETALQNALDASGISRTRTTQDTGTKLSNIAQNTDAFQNQDAYSFDNNRTNLIGNVAASGLIGSGIGQQQISNAEGQRNYASGLKMQDFSQQKAQTQLASDRTFEDLARSDTLSTQATGQQKQKVTVDLNRALQDINTETGNQRNVFEAQRLSDILSQEGAYQKSLGQQWLQSLQGKVSAGTYTATAQSLAGMF